MSIRSVFSLSEFALHAINPAYKSVEPLFVGATHVRPRRCKDSLERPFSSHE